MGELLRDTLHMPLVDVDAEIIKAIGTDIPTFFKTHGEAAFRQEESRVIANITMTGGKIIACGGGAALKKENRDHLRMNGKVVWIKRA